jgi:tRNA modification GTPase
MVRDIREGVMDLLVELEARLDFDEDLPPMDLEGLQQDVADLQAQIEAALRTAREGSLLRNGLQVAIVGRPNVGKSSLLNSWTRTNRAIVTDIAGTTRDVLEAGLVVSGVPITLLDTAGIRASSDTVEKMGVERSTQAATAADLVMMVVDGSTGWTEADGDIFRSLWGDGAGSRSCKVRGQALLVVNKCDLSGEGPGVGVFYMLVRVGEGQLLREQPLLAVRKGREKGTGRGGDCPYKYQASYLLEAPCHARLGEREGVRSRAVKMAQASGV